MNAQKPTIAVLPAKRFDGAKQRLADTLSGGARRALAEAMLTDVLLALKRTDAVDRVMVVTGEPAALAIGRGYEAEVIDDTSEQGHTAAASIGVAQAIIAGAGRVLLVPGDCPAADPAELNALLSHPEAGPGSAIIVPDRHGSGTNALLLDPPDAIAPSFGPDSRQRHEVAALAAGVRCAVEPVPSLVLDVDTGDDLLALQALLGSRRGGAAHTRGLLTRILP